MRSSGRRSGLDELDLYDEGRNETNRALSHVTTKAWLDEVDEGVRELWGVLSTIEPRLGAWKVLSSDGFHKNFPKKKTMHRDATSTRDDLDWPQLL